VPFKNIKPWPIPLVRNNQSTLFPMPQKQNHFEKQKRNLQLSLNIPLISPGKGEKKEKESPHSTPPHPTSDTTPHKKREKNSTLPSSLFKFSPLNPST